MPCLPLYVVQSVVFSTA